MNDLDTLLSALTNEVLGAARKDLIEHIDYLVTYCPEHEHSISQCRDLLETVDAEVQSRDPS